MTYHVLNGSYAASAFKTTPQFLPSLLTNTTYANVTGGQRVEGLLNGSSVEIFSGLLSKSTVVTAVRLPPTTPLFPSLPNVLSRVSSLTDKTQDLTFTGGVLHIIDTVLTIPESDSATAVAANLTALAGALTSANLVSTGKPLHPIHPTIPPSLSRLIPTYLPTHHPLTLKPNINSILTNPQTVNSLSDVTIFAPSNAAFAAIGSALGSLTTTQLTQILTYHVVTGTVGYSSLLTNTTLKTVNGESLTITILNGSVFVNSARVITPNVLVANGVVHVIDGVLNPNNTAATPNPSTTTAAFSGASSASGVPFTSGVTQSGSVMTTATPSSMASSSLRGAGAAGVRVLPTGVVEMGVLLGGAVVFAAGL